jgi:AcrR family transcriptional regulator
VTEHRARPEQIVTEAARLFASKGFAATTVREIGDAVGMQSGSLYKYFRSKDDIVAEVLFAYLDDDATSSAEALAGADSAAARLEALVEATFRTMLRHRDACEIAQSDERLLLHLPATAELRERSEQIRRTWFETIESAAAEGVVRRDVDVHSAYWFIRGAMWFTVRWFEPGGAISVDEIIEQFHGFIQRGYQPTEGRRR